MAKQIDSPLVEGTIFKKSYYRWLCEKSELEGPLAPFLFETDFKWTDPDDANRAADGIGLREQYADEVGADLDPNMKDKLQKSIHGKCCLFELLLSLANHIDAMVNEGEESMAPDFFHIMLENLKLTDFDEEDYDHDPEKCVSVWSNSFLGGCNAATLFPTKDNKPGTIWQKMNDWVDENTDEDGYFILE